MLHIDMLVFSQRPNSFFIDNLYWLYLFMLFVIAMWLNATIFKLLFESLFLWNKIIRLSGCIEPIIHILPHKSVFYFTVIELWNPLIINSLNTYIFFQIVLLKSPYNYESHHESNVSLHIFMSSLLSIYYFYPTFRFPLSKNPTSGEKKSSFNVSNYRIKRHNMAMTWQSVNLWKHQQRAEASSATATTDQRTNHPTKARRPTASQRHRLNNSCRELMW